MADTKTTTQTSGESGAAGAGRQSASRATTSRGHALRIAKGDLTWQHGIHHVSAAHGQELTERARDLVRRALGELYQESQGGPQASNLAHNVAANIGNTGALNRLGTDASASAYAQLNQLGAEENS